METLVRFPLQDYDSISKYDEVCRKRFGRTYDIGQLVRKACDLRRPDCPLTAAHVVELFDPAESHFGHFWKPPLDLEEKLHSRWISLARPVGADERAWRGNVVAAVFEFLGSVEAVSVLLRCVYPDDFAVYSPPTLNLLQLPAQNPVEHYLAYCDELRVWGAHFGTCAVAPTDQALWLFYEWSYGPACLKLEDAADPRDARARRREFENDKWVRERQATNVLRPFFHKWSTLEQVECLADVDSNLASMIAGCELEKRLRRATGLQDEDVPSLIQHFCTQADTNPDRRREVKQQLRKAWKLRNRTVHAQSNTDYADVRMMIEIIKELLPERGDGILGGF
jgi:hypothetical protein